MQVILMKGQMQTVVILIIAMIILYGFLQYIFIVQEEAVFRSAVLNAIQVSNIINILQSSPNDAFQIYTLPAADCVLEITESYINFTLGKQSYRRDFIQTSTKIKETKIECRKPEKTRSVLCITKKNGVITAKELLDTCW